MRQDAQILYGPACTRMKLGHVTDALFFKIVFLFHPGLFFFPFLFKKDQVQTTQAKNKQRHQEGQTAVLGHSVSRAAGGMSLPQQVMGQQRMAPGHEQNPGLGILVQPLKVKIPEKSVEGSLHPKPLWVKMDKVRLAPKLKGFWKGQHAYNKIMLYQRLDLSLKRG